MSEGKLFLFHFRNPVSRETEVKKAWLCEDCFESWEVVLDQAGHVQLHALVKMAG
jgi:hypothetical protein